MMTEFDVQLSARDLFRFNMRNTYTSLQGPISIIIAILFVISGVVSATNGKYQYTVLYVAVAILFLVYIPITLNARAKKTFRTNEVLSGKLHYVISEEGIEVHSGDEKGTLPWDMIFKMTANQKYLFIYSNRINAYIIPREQITDCYADIKALATQKLPKYRIKMK